MKKIGQIKGISDMMQKSEGKDSVIKLRPKAKIYEKSYQINSKPEE